MVKRRVKVAKMNVKRRVCHHGGSMVKKSNIHVSEVVYGAMLPANAQQPVERSFTCCCKIILWNKPRTKIMWWNLMSIT